MVDYNRLDLLLALLLVPHTARERAKQHLQQVCAVWDIGMSRGCQGSSRVSRETP